MKDPCSPRWLLVTDVDDTLDGDEAALQRFARERGSLLLVLNSSRPKDSVLRTMKRFPRELVVDGLITALGTEIILDGTEIAEWTQRFEGWDRRPADDLMAREGVSRHPPEMQTRYKASYSVPPERREELKTKILDLVADTQVILSGASDFDAVPRAAGKDQATLFVAGTLGVSRERMIVAGDSGNDLAMFDASDMAIAVGNSRRELSDHADPIRTYFARASHASGLLEGLLHWGALT